MESVFYFFQSVIETFRDSVSPELNPFTQHDIKAFYLWFAVEADDIHVDTVISFKVCCCKKMRHQRFTIDPVGFWCYHKSGW